MSRIRNERQMFFRSPDDGGGSAGGAGAEHKPAGGADGATEQKTPVDGDAFFSKGYGFGAKSERQKFAKFVAALQDGGGDIEDIGARTFGAQWDGDFRETITKTFSQLGKGSAGAGGGAVHDAEGKPKKPSDLEVQLDALKKQNAELKAKYDAEKKEWQARFEETQINVQLQTVVAAKAKDLVSPNIAMMAYKAARSLKLNEGGEVIPRKPDGKPIINPTTGDFMTVAEDFAAWLANDPDGSALLRASDSAGRGGSVAAGGGVFADKKMPTGLDEYEKQRADIIAKAREMAGRG